MNESPASPTPSQPSVVVRRKGLGCVPTGCIIVVIVLLLVGIGFASMFWLFYQGGQAFVSDRSTLTHPAPTEQEYQEVLAKLSPFARAMNEGRAATVEITPEDLNALIARSPQFQYWRGKLFLDAKDDHLSADVSAPISYDGKHTSYFNGHAAFDASYTSNGFTLYLRRLDPLDQGQGSTRFARFLNHDAMLKAFSQQISHDFNENLRQQAKQDPATADLLRKLRTVVVQGGQIVVTTGDVGTTLPASPTDSAQPAPMPGSSPP